jgi:hypothetical protein
MKQSYACGALAAVLASSICVLAADCRPVNGHFEANVVAPGTGHCPPVPGIFCTAGRVWGGIQGDYKFVMSGATPAATIGGIPTALFFAGQSVVSLQDGSIVDGTDSGTLDLPPGQLGFASLISFTSGGSGQIRLRGQFDPVAGITAGDYVGSFCGA